MKERLYKLYRLFGRQDKMRLVKLFILIAIGAVLDVVGVGAVPAFVASLSMPDEVMAHPAVVPILAYLNITDPRDMVLWMASALITVYVAKNLFLVFIVHVRTRTVEHFKTSLTLRLFDAYARAPYQFHLQRNSSELLRNVTMETNTIVSNVVNEVLMLAMAVLMSIMIVTLMMVATPEIALGAVLFVGFGSWFFLRMVREALHKYGIQAQTEKKRSIQFINQTLRGIVEARVLGVTGHFIRRFHESDKNWASARRHYMFISGSTGPILETISILGILSIVIIVVSTSSDFSTLIPILTLLGIAVIRLKSSLTQIVKGIGSMRFSLVAIDPVYDDLELLLHGRVRQQPSILRRKDSIPPEFTFDNNLEVADLSYRYPDSVNNALTKINLTIVKGTAVGFVGSTGSGKSTLINILLGILEPGSGSINVDGRDINDNIDGWRRNVGYIPQVIYLLDDTIRRNVAFGIEDDEIDDTKVWSAIRAAQLENYVNDLDKGFDSVVGESGSRISGGQRQRIGLARALYHDPPVLIMDEATSSLDNQTENLVMEALNELRSERTFIMIAHRLSTVQDCDILYFMRDGEITASGTFEEMSTTHSEFQEMTVKSRPLPSSRDVR